jgi:hypothetical protein
MVGIKSQNPEQFADLVRPELGARSGAVFYSGRAAFSGSARLYLLGLNPGGSPIRQADETIAGDLANWRNGPARWSAYSDRSWRGMPPGTYGIQPRVLHMFEKLGLHPSDVPASNVVFVRTNDEGALTKEKASLLGSCWPVHKHVIDELGVTTIACLGGTAGRWARSMLEADELAGRFIESNSRGWTSEAHLSRSGVCVLTLSHPGRADWRNPAADPTPLVREILDR